MPDPATVHRWITAEKVPGIAQDIMRARELGYDAIAEQARMVARGEKGYTTNDVQRDKLIIETDLKLLAKWSKRYADKSHVEVTGKDGEPLSLRLIDAHTRLIKDVTPQNLIEHEPHTSLDDII